MLLSDVAILDSIREGRIQIRPRFCEEHLRPVGLRVHLGHELLIPVPGQIVDLADPAQLQYERLDLSHEPYILEPGSFVLGSTIEEIQTAPDIISILEGRSTIARLGISIHNTASILDGAQVDWLTPVLEIANLGNFQVVLRPGTPIGMVCFQSMTRPSSEKRHHCQYAQQRGTTPPNLSRGAILDDLCPIIDQNRRKTC